MTDKELYKLCQEYGRKARKWKNKFVALLPEVYRRRLYKKRGYCSIYEFAAKMAGVSHNVVDEVIRFDEKFKEMPKLKALISEVGLSKLRVVENVAKKETDSFWANKAKTMTRNALSTYIKDIRPGTEQDQNANFSLFDEQNMESEEQDLKTQNRYMSNRERFGMDLDPKTIIKLRLIKQKFEKEKGEALGWDEVIRMVADKLLSEAPIREYKQRLNKSRNASAKQKREMPKICEVPGCNKPAEEIHHTKPWAIFKKHDDLKALCKGHHELEHQGDLLIDKKFRRYKHAFT